MDDEHDTGDMPQDLKKHIAADDEHAGFMMHVNVMVGDEDYWVYLMVPIEKYDAFLAAQDDPMCNIKEYGEIVEWGPGSDAPAHVQRQMEIDFGLRPNAADHLSNMANQLGERMKHMGKREDDI